MACLKKKAPAAARAFGARLTSIVERLRAAAPRATIVLTGIWNFDAAHLEQTDSLVQSFNASTAKATVAAHARYASTFSIFRPQAKLCALTFACSKQDPHPTDMGYKAIAAAVLVAGGFPTK